MRLATRERYITYNPCLETKSVKKKKVLKKYNTIEELKILDKNRIPMNYDSQEAYLFSCFSGLRYSDDKGLKKKHLRIREIKRGKKVIKITEVQMYQFKTEEPVYIPLPPQALKYLPDLDTLDEEDLIFHLPVTVDAVGKQLVKWGEYAGLKKRINFHMSRHTYAVNILVHGGDIYTLQNLLGHTDIRSTQVYAQIVDSMKDKAVANMPEF